MGLFYSPKKDRSVSGTNSSGFWFCLNNLADKSPFNIILEPVTSNQLPSRNPKTGVSLKAWNLKWLGKPNCSVGTLKRGDV